MPEESVEASDERPEPPGGALLEADGLEAPGGFGAEAEERRGLARGAQEWEGESWQGTLDPASGWDKRRPVLDRLVREFLAGPSWEAAVVVADGTMPGLALRNVFERHAAELLRSGAVRHGAAQPRLPWPTWVDDSGLALDLSARFGRRDGRAAWSGAFHPDDLGWTAVRGGGDAGRPGYVELYQGVLVIDTLHSRPRRSEAAYQPQDGPSDGSHEGVAGTGHAGRHRLPEPDEASAGSPGSADAHGPDASGGPGEGAVIVTDLVAAGERVVDAGVLWRQACGQVCRALYDPAVARARSRAREAVRELRHAVLVDPRQGLGLVVFVDMLRRPWSVLGFTVEEDAVEGRVRLFWP